MKLILKNCFLMIAVSASTALNVVGQRDDRVDRYVQAEMSRQKIPGLALAVVREGKVVKVKGYGLANVETGGRTSENTAFRLGSVSKQFLAAGIMLLVQDGKLDLNERVGKYFPDAPEAWSEITVRHLLSHTSGLIRDVPDFDALKQIPDAEAIRRVYSLPLDSPAGTKWQYSNVGYYILAEMITRISGQPWRDFIAERIFGPLGMNRTRTADLIEIVPERASGYTLTDKGWENGAVWIALRPPGAFLSTATDMAKWDAALYSARILSAATREQMWTPIKLKDGSTASYGFGWFIDEVNGHRRVYHYGSQPGFKTMFVRYLDEKLTVIILTNLSSGDAPRIAQAVAGFYIPNPALPTYHP